jgi:hypothetical protein
VLLWQNLIAKLSELDTLKECKALEVRVILMIYETKIPISGDTMQQEGGGGGGGEGVSIYCLGI